MTHHTAKANLEKGSSWPPEVIPYGVSPPTSIWPNYWPHMLDMAKMVWFFRNPRTIRLLKKDYPAGNDFMQVWTNLCYRECFCKTSCWQELHFEFSRQNLNRNMQSPSMWWWLITQPRPIWKKAPPGLQRPSHTDSGISGVLYWPKLPVPHLGPDPRPPIPHNSHHDSIIN